MVLAGFGSKQSDHFQMKKGIWPIGKTHRPTPNLPRLKSSSIKKAS